MGLILQSENFMTGESPQISNVWVQRSLGVDLSKNRLSFTSVDVEYLCDNCYPFVQLVNANAVFTEETSINFITTPKGWVIHDYGEAISVARPHEVVAKKDLTDTTKEHSNFCIDGSKGGQMAAINEVAALIATKGWIAIDVIAGTKMMQRLLWIESKRYGFGLNGYIPGESDEKCYERLLKHTKANGVIWEKQVALKPKTPNNASGAD